MSSPNHFLLAVKNLTPAEMSDISIVLLYAAVLIIVTSIISLKTKDPDPMLAGRNMPWWLIAGSIIGTSISSIAFLAYPSKGFCLDFNCLLGTILEPFVSIPIVLIFFIGFLRKTKDASIYSLLELRFGKWASIFAAICFILSSIFRMGIITCLVGEAIHAICGVDIISVIFLTGALVLFYTYMSGIEGVIWTDLFQTIVLTVVGVGAAVFLWNLLIDNDIALAKELSSIYMSLKENTSQPQFSFNNSFINGLFFVIFGVQVYTTNQGIAQRYLVARSEKDAKLGLVTGAVIIPLIVILFFFVGVLLYLFYLKGSPELSLDANQLQNAFGYFIAHYFPNGLKGLAIIGILAAAMSTIDTGINSSSTVFICNLYEPYMRSPESKKSLLTAQILRASSIVFALIGILTAYFVYIHGENVLELFWKIMGVLNSSIFGLFILLRFSKKVGKISGIIGASVGFCLCLWMTFTGGLDHPLASSFHYMLALPVSLLITVAVGLCASLLVKDRELHQGLELENAICDKLRRDVAQKRKRIKKNVFTDSLRPKVFYRIYALAIMIGLMIFAYEGVNFSLTNLDYQFLRASIVCLFFVVVCPFLIENTFSKRYTFIYLSLLGFSLPFFGAVMMFSHFNNVFFGYFYLGSIFVLGTMIGWTMLSTITMLATAFAGQISAFLYPEMGVPGNWAILSIGVLSIFTYYAILAARESIAIEKCLTVVHTIAKKMLNKTLNTASRLILSGRSLTLQDMHILVKGVGEVESTLSCLVGATNLEPEQALIPLSIKTSLHHALKRFSIQAKNSVRIEGEDDFYVLGSRDIFENILFHLLDNAIYYLERNEATLIICTLDAQKKTLSIANNGPTIHLKDRLYIFLI